MTPRLIVLNGPPAVGKSTLARRYAAEHPLTLNLDVDRVRDLIGGWRDDAGAAGLLARAIAVAAARTHLLAGRGDLDDGRDDALARGPATPGGGYDVVVAQLVARPGFLEQLEAVAEEVGATFHELVLMDAKPAVLRRFAARARTTAGAPDAEPAEVAALYDRLTAHLESRPRVVVVPARESAVDETYRRLLAHLDDEG
ncbi:AAA family ATPase [Jiangella endophytica]|uniref:AAA family ATPase n=1 Tax=Jiangella endophytica TaxID=1623398 RepID=UPI000E35298D|nr:AAA family ATPase [Jiangella endophytica]